MDGSTLEHSDSDSGESWTILESGPVYGDDAPGFGDHSPMGDGSAADAAEKDEDTDGISIISDSDPETSTPCELSYDKCLLEENRPSDPQKPEFVSVNPVPPNKHDTHESIRDDEDFLGDNNGKLKTYVHKRNKRLSTMLNIIVLGSVITAAGVAVGHMWGARHDCSSAAAAPAPAVNKILSNLYKLQEENAFLRNKLRELTLVSNLQLLRADKPPAPLKLHRCKKVFEESLTNKHADRLTKCVDNENEKILEGNMLEFEKEFLSDIEKLKNVYQQNKSWLDEEISRRMKREEQYINKIRVNNLKSPKSIRINEELKTLQNERIRRQTATEPPISAEEIINVTEPLVQSVHMIEVEKEIIPERRITYADSLKSSHKVVKRDANEMNFQNNKIRDHIKKKKPNKQFETISENLSDEELKKDDRYVPQKFKAERKKNDRHKIHKKQKRRNKYEQWEMKGGYLKDYDDFSIPSSYENEYVLKNPDKNYLSKEFERNNYINQFSDLVDVKKPKEVVETKSENLTAKTEKGKEANWYEKRVALRTEARRKLEKELFGESSPNTAQWYFRRMQRRELCRDNSTHKRLNKRNMNYKTKH